MSAYSPFGGSGFRTTNPRRKDRRCRNCEGLIDGQSPHIICGNCHAQRMAALERDEG